MSLLPMLFSDWWEELERPHRLLDQHFGLSLSPEDLPSSALTPLESEILVIRPRRRGLRRYQPYERSLTSRKGGSGVSTVQADKDKFQVTLDVQQFNPDEVSVKVVDKTVVVEGKHEEKQDEHGWISRQFVRKYLVPEQCDIDQLKSSLSSDGVLTITAPRREPEPKQNERIIKIQSTGQPAIREDHQANEKMDHQESPAKNQQQPQQRPQEKTVKAA